MPIVHIDSLIEDFTLYPRTMVCPTHVNALIDALKVDVDLPPIVADKKSSRVIDGFHRLAAYRRLKVDTVAVEWLNCKNEQELFAFAVEANAGHGRPYSPYDRARIRGRAEDLGFTLERVGQILKMPVESLTAQKERVFAADPEGKPTPLKNTIAWKAGQRLTEREMKANEKLGGMNATFYVNQVIELLEARLIDPRNEGLQASLLKLHELLGKHIARASKKKTPTKAAALA